VVGTSFRPAWSWFKGNTAAAAGVTMEDGLVVNYNATMVAQGSDTPQEGIITIAGEQGTLQLDERSQIRLFGEGEPRTIPPVPVPEGELGHALAEFVDAIRARRLPETHVADNIRSLALPLAVLESARRRQAVRMEELLSFLG
jgi:predicted dehydrogenase